MKKNQLIDTYNLAVQFGRKYIGVKIQTRGEEEAEYSIHLCKGVAKKMACWMRDYDEDMILKRNSNIRITCAAAADTMEEVKELLEAQYDND
jgi:hypothetical protein